MKKALTALLAAAMMMSLAACNNGKSNPPSSASQPISGSQPGSASQSGGQTASGPRLSGDYIFATGGTAGTYYGFGGIVAQVLNAATGANITANSTGASVENARLIASGDADIAFIQTDVISYALDGINNFEDGKLENLKTVASIYPEMIHIVTVDDSVNSIDDLRGKAVSVGAPGSGDEANARHILAAYGMDYDDIDARFLSNAEASAAMQDGTISAALYATGAPNPGLVELSLVKPMRLISLDQKAMDYLLQQGPFYTRERIEKDVYGTAEGADVLAVKAAVAVRAEMSDDEVYALTKALFENKDQIAAMHVKGEEISLETALDGIRPESLHPGAVRYYEEMNVEIG